MAESKFNSEFRKRMLNYGFRIYRVESHATCPGIPDNHYLGPHGITGWIEMKEDVGEKPPARMDFRPAQIPWLLDYSRRGGKCWALLHHAPGDRVYLIRGEDAGMANLSLPKAASLLFYPAKELWKVAEVIRRG